MATETTTNTSDSGFSADELAAMKQRAAELRAEKKGGAKKADEAEAWGAAVMGLSGPDPGLAEAIHRIVLAVAPELDPKTWYGFPSYARDGKVVVFFKPASKFKSRYAPLGSQEGAPTHAGAMWVTSYAVIEIGRAEEKLITKLVK